MKKLLLIPLMFITFAGCAGTFDDSFDQKSTYTVTLKSGEVEEISCYTHTNSGCEHGFTSGDDGTFIIICQTNMFPLTEITKIKEEVYSLDEFQGRPR